MPQALVAALATQGVTSPFPIQTATLPDALAGRDVLGRGRTGSGKTYAFVVPLLARLAASGTRRRPGRPRALILAPTRELATQIEASLTPLADTLSMRVLTVFGGVGARPQINALAKGVDVLVACPGRLEDHVRSGHASLDSVEVTVLDEADHMADLGFLPAVRRLLDQTPEDGQRLLFSATLDAAVDVLVRRFLYKPVTHSVDSPQSPVETMSHHMLHVRADDRFPVLVDLTAAPGRSLVFTRTKRGAKVLTKKLVAAGVPAVELHGNLAQNARTRNMSDFAEGKVRTLVATDIAARGIHVDDVTLVIHADPPAEHKAYLHRSGRTARAGAAGTVVTLMTDAQVADVRDLANRAGIKPTTTRLRLGDPLLAELAPGQRSFVQPEAVPPGRASGGSSGGTSGGGGDRTRTAGRRQSPAAGRTSGSGRATVSGRAADSGRAAGGSRTADAGRVAEPRRGAGTGRAAAADGHAPRPTRSRRAGAGRAGTASAAPAPRSGGAAAFSSRSRAGRSR
ncbi:RNA helicase [Virgisporangium aurantiacum]|uniref:RNA helicase n=1 Tax=Virgisporangium aurantiacum TaxID=175570 RepID=A0A8J3YVH3_9ACTN|nr:RNA helicase [Virgisporangium aurantiacum]